MCLLHIRTVLFEQLAAGFERLRTLLAQRDEIANLLDRHARVLQAADEAEPLQIRIRIVPNPALGARQPAAATLLFHNNAAHAG